MTEIGKAYGGSLFMLAREEGLDAAIGRELTSLCGALREDYDYVRLMVAPTLKKSKRLEILAETFEGKVHEYVLNFMSILVENGTFEEIFSCAEEYRTLYNREHGIVDITAVTAVPLDGGLSDKLAQRLESVLNKKVVLQNRVDPGVIGGVRLELDGESIDGSVRSRLDGIKAALFSAKA